MESRNGDLELTRSRGMDAVAEGYVAGLRVCFEPLRDPRMVGCCDHLLIDILPMALLAVM